MHKVSKVSRGVPDLELKLQICKFLLGAYTDVELAERVFRGSATQQFALKVADNFRKWAKHRPTMQGGPRRFWDRLALELKCDEAVTGVMLINADIDRFIGYLPEGRQGRAQELLADIRSRKGETLNFVVAFGPPLAGRAPGLDANVIWLRHEGPLETLATGFRAGKIDQKHYYLDPDSAKAWGRLVNADAYPTYDHCKSGLQVLFDSEPWKELVKSSQPLSAVMLTGGGAPTKDLLLMKSLLAQTEFTKPLHYHLLDISFYMLIDSRSWIYEHGPTVDGFDRLHLALIYHDVLKMTSVDRELFHKHGKAVFAITGGTIGNFSEAAFFRSLGRAAEDGDLLIISADTVDGVPSDSVEKTLIQKYNNPALRKFIEPVVRGVVSESRAPESASTAVKRIDVKLRPGKDTNASDVPSSWSVNVRLNIDNRDISLVTSTRYESSELIKYASRFGWEEIHQVASPLNPHFKQFLFRWNKSETSGIKLIP